MPVGLGALSAVLIGVDQVQLGQYLAQAAIRDSLAVNDGAGDLDPKAPEEKASASAEAPVEVPHAAGTEEDSGLCEHGRRRRLCKECSGSSICEHGRHHNVNLIYVMS